MMDLKKWKIFKNLDSTFTANIKSACILGVDSLTAATGAGGQQIPECRAALMVMKDGDVYSIALTSDDLAMLGVAKFEGLSPLVPMKMSALCGLGIRAVGSGLTQASVVTMDGRVYEWGREYKILGKGKLLKPRFMSGKLSGRKVAHVACGRMHTLALTVEGDVYAWGSSGSGQIGNGSRISTTDPVKISGSNGFDKRIVQLACGGWTSFALDCEGNVWSWGGYSYGTLGFHTEVDLLVPRKISLRSIKQIAAGKHHVLSLSNEGKVYFWGQHTESEAMVVTPKEIDIPNVLDIGVVRGCSVSAFKTAEGKVYFWGFAYGLRIPEPVATEFGSLDELYASLDTPVMLTPVRLKVQLPEIVTEKLRLSFDDKESGDVRFEVEGRSIHVHKQFLKLRSDHFKRMFANNWEESSGGETIVKITNFTYSEFRTFLLYLYTDRVEPPPRTVEEFIEMFELADNYGEESLKRHCEEQLRALITTDNFSTVYAISIQYNAQILHAAILDFAIPNFNDVVKSEGYKNMQDALKNSLIQELADEDAFIGMAKKPRLM